MSAIISSSKTKSCNLKHTKIRKFSYDSKIAETRFWAQRLGQLFLLTGFLSLGGTVLNKVNNLDH